MEAVIRLAQSLEFRIWRWLYTVIMIAWTSLLLSVEGLVPFGTGTLFLCFGVLPCAVFLLLRRSSRKLDWWFAYGYDVVICLLFVAVVLIIRPNSMGIFFMTPIAGFIVETIFLTIVLGLGSKPATWFAYTYDVALLLLLVVLMITQPNYRFFYGCLMAGCITQGLLLTIALERDNRWSSPDVADRAGK